MTTSAVLDAPPGSPYCPACGAVVDGSCPICDLARFATDRKSYELFGLVEWFGGWDGEPEGENED